MRSLLGLLPALPLLASTLALAPVARGVTFADGQVHVIDANNSFPGESVLVNDGPDGSSTTVVLVPGGRAGASIDGRGSGLRLTGQSILMMSGGQIGFTLDVDGGNANISGGSIPVLTASGGSLTISGGEFTGTAGTPPLNRPGFPGDSFS